VEKIGPMILFYVLVLSIPLNNHWLLSGRGDFTVFKGLGLACLPFALAHLAFRSASLKLNAIFPALAAVFVIEMFSYFSHGGTLGAPVLANRVSMLLLFFLIIALVDSIARLRRVILVMIGSVTITAVYVVRDWQFNRMIADYRPGGISGDANYFALCASTCMLLSLQLVLSRPTRWEKRYLYACLAITSVAFLMAASRGGFVGLAIGLLFLMFRSGKGVRAVLLIGLVIVPLLVLVPNTSIQRIFHPGTGDDEAVDARHITWAAGLRMIEAHPIGGVGLGQFRNLVASYEGINDKINGQPVRSLAHNTYIEVAAELGIPGLLAYLALIWSGFRAWSRAARLKEQPTLREVAIGFQAAMIAATVCAIFVSASWFRFLWLVQLLPACLSTIEQRLVRRLAATGASETKAPEAVTVLRTA
jgi:putative inorganic carbon (hco3(-)) transporter